MSGFTQQAFEKKLAQLNSSQQSIQTLSLWLVHHRKHYKVIVQTWFKELKKVKPSKRLTFLYLANDVIQNSKKKGPEYTKEFANALKSTFDFISKDIEETTLASVERLVKIWEERGIYDKNTVLSLRQALNSKSTDNNSNKDKNSSSSKSTNNNTKRENEDKKENKSSKKLATEKLDNSIINSLMPQISNLVEDVSVDLSNYEQVEPDKLIQTLKELENCASADQNVQQKIESLPSEVFDVKKLESVVDKDSIDHWSKIVNDAQSILSSYNSRLAQELVDRKKLSKMLAFFIEGQKRSLSQAEQSLNEYRDKLRKVVATKEELTSHLQNLPDLSQFEAVQPLPSALDLFKL